MTQQIRKYGINPLEYCKYNPVVDFDSIQEQKDALGVDDNTVIEFGKGIVIDEPKPQTNKYLTFTSVEENVDVSIKFTNGGIDPVANYSLEYSIDGGTIWEPYQLDTGVTLPNFGDSVLFRGDNHECVFSKRSYIRCVIKNHASASGDITSIFNGVGGDAELTEWCFFNMFSDCKPLTTAPALPATELSNYCYAGMFYGCTALTTAPVLPATTLTQNCYENMFADCTVLTTAPVLPATTLSKGCYNQMFYGCTALNSITCLATDISAPNCTTSWVYGVSESGTFTKAAGMNSWTTGKNGIPQGWTVL